MAQEWLSLCLDLLIWLYFKKKRSSCTFRCVTLGQYIAFCHQEMCVHTQDSDFEALVSIPHSSWKFGTPSNYKGENVSFLCGSFPQQAWANQLQSRSLLPFQIMEGYRPNCSEQNTMDEILLHKVWSNLAYNIDLWIIIQYIMTATMYDYLDIVDDTSIIIRNQLANFSLIWIPQKTRHLGSLA